MVDRLGPMDGSQRRSRSARSRIGSEHLVGKTRKLRDIDEKEKREMQDEFVMQVIDYNAQGRWSCESIQERYADYARKFSWVPRDLKPFEDTGLLRDDTI